MQTALDFVSTLVLKDHSKWKANKNEHGEGDNAHPNVRSKSYNNERKILTHHEIRNCRKNCVSDHSSVQRNKIVDLSEFTAELTPLSSLTFVL